MHLLHRSSMFGGVGRAPRRGGAGSPRAPPARHQQLLFSKSDSIKKRTGGAAKGSKRARLRAGLAAALQDLRLAGRHSKRGSSPVPAAGAATRTTRPGSEVGLEVAACHAADGAAASSSPEPEGRTAASASGGGGAPLLVLLLLALLCVVTLVRAPAVCCCTCAAWLCRGTSTTATGKRQAPPPERRARR